ncbi:MAG TPA: glycosyltransferase family 39 protein [Nitrososphaerales archaeon]|nr:glycosyltransferase family 39 protein [Nitrososphaerales archaeon]
MKVSDAPQGVGILPRALRLLLLGVLVDLALLIVVIFVHVATSSEALLTPAPVLGAGLVAFSLATVAVGVTYAWRAFPAHRRAMAFVVGLTLVVLLAHMYIIGFPPASDSRALSGTIGTQVVSGDKDGSGNPILTINSSLTGQLLRVTVRASGSEAIANVQVNAPSHLSGSGFSSPPSYSDPLGPGSSATGTWTLPTQPTQLNITYQSLNCYNTGSRNYGCIMDEVFYVPEAVGVLSGEHCATTISYCHMEHPYLVPALIAGGMAVFGTYNAVGWRIMPALLGTFSIPLLFGIAWKVSGDKKVAYLSALLLSLDVMFFSQSSGALLDVPEVFFGLAAFFAYFAGLRWWKLDKYIIAGIFLGVAGLAKETAVFIALAFLTYLLLFGEGSRGSRVYSIFKVALVLALVFAVGLQAYDSTLGSPAMPTFVQHVGYVLSYGSSLKADKLACQPTTGYWCKFPNDPGGAPILPFDWLLYYSPVAYFATSVSVCPNTVNGVCQGGQYSYVSLAYYGVTNLIQTWTVFVWVPLAAFVVYRHFRRPQPRFDQFGFADGGTPAQSTPGITRFAGLALTMFLWTYVPYIFIFLTQRVTYPFYFIPAVPAVALGASYWLTRDWFPSKLMYVYLAMAFIFFFVYFPAKGFLPDWLRVIIGH